MQKENSIEFKVYGRYALFSDPITRVGGEKMTYSVPTYQALKGICESIYWKPTFTWIVDKVRVMKDIQTESKGIRPVNYGGGNTLSLYTYLRDVEYQVKAHFEWNENRPEFEQDRNENKHFFIAKRMLERGGRRDIFLGTRECQAYVEPCSFGEDSGYFDQVQRRSFGIMLHGITYPDEAYSSETKGKLSVRFSDVLMKDGIITFLRPEECSLVRVIKEMEMKEFGENGFLGLQEFEREGEKFELDNEII
ncbi:MAG: type I-C CRISPR-associated protein Cas5c [Lachnospiraceae bacterium]|nr:type I-C CRISPR-associated protein Cas5c [Lachnospiraceae bacterium]